MIILSQALRDGERNNFKAVSCRIVNSFTDWSGEGKRKIKNMRHRQPVQRHADEVGQEV